MLEHNELELVRRAIAGDRVALETVFDQCLVSMQAAVFGIMRSRSHEEREDVVQTATVLLIDALHGFRGESRLRAFAAGVARNCALQYVTRASTTRMTSFDPLNPAFLKLCDGEDETSLETVIETRELSVKLEQHLAQELTPRDQLYLALILDGLSPEEIAVIMGLDDRNATYQAKSRIRKVGKALVKKLSGEDDNPP